MLKIVSELKLFKILAVLVCVVAVMWLYGCVDGPKPYSEMSSVEKATWMMSVYNSQYTDYMTTMGYSVGQDGKWVKTFDPTLSNEQSNILRIKKTALTRVYFLINLYIAQSKGGADISKKTEAEVIKMLDQL